MPSAAGGLHCSPLPARLRVESAARRPGAGGRFQVGASPASSGSSTCGSATTRSSCVRVTPPPRDSERVGREPATTPRLASSECRAGSLTARLRSLRESLRRGWHAARGARRRRDSDSSRRPSRSREQWSRAGGARGDLESARARDPGLLPRRRSRPAGRAGGPKKTTCQNSQRQLVCVHNNTQSHVRLCMITFRHG